MKRNGKAGRAGKRFLGRSPNWLRTAAIAKPQGQARERGSFGPASAVVSIDPETGLPREGAQ